jgi:Ser/Thr protein kinase RdoA (MazF antagonist)
MQIYKIYKHHINYALTHNDLHYNNLLYTGSRFYLIDWEGAGLSDPYFDLANYCTFFIFDNKLENIFLGSYGRNLSQTQLNKLTVMKTVSKGYYGYTLYYLIHKNYTAEEINKVNLLEYYNKDDTPLLKKYLINKNVLNLDSIKKMLDLSLIFTNTFLEEVETQEFQEALKNLEKIHNKS